MKDAVPHFLADISLYPSEDGGRKSPITADWFGCPVKVHERDFSAFDFRMLTCGERFSPGETKRFGVVFSVARSGSFVSRSAEILPLGRPYYWRGKTLHIGSKNDSDPQL